LYLKTHYKVLSSPISKNHWHIPVNIIAKMTAYNEGHLCIIKTITTTTTTTTTTSCRDQTHPQLECFESNNRFHSKKNKQNSSICWKQNSFKDLELLFTNYRKIKIYSRSRLIWSHFNVPFTTDYKVKITVYSHLVLPKR